MSAKSILQHTVVASGLLSRDDLDQVLEVLRAEALARNEVSAVNVSAGDTSTDIDGAAAKNTIAASKEGRPLEAAGRSGGKSGSNAHLAIHIPDDILGERLISTGKLNTWQVEQLRNGRTKFTLGRYQTIDSIGKGGMGSVFKAEDTVMGRIVAVKVLPREKSTPEAIASFQREIRTQAQLDHENLVRAFDAGHDGNVHFLVTEFVPGTDLRRLVRGSNVLSMQQGASVISQAARGLAHAHQRGLIHRDIKPANLLVMPDGRVKVLDLGLAGFFNDPEQIDQYGGKVVGTADYMAPETILTPDKLDKRSDIYSLGCTMYYAVTGKVPFPGGDIRDKAKNHCSPNVQPIDPRRFNSELSDDFVEVIADMMAKKPDKRLGSGEEVIARLAPWAEESRTTTLVAEPILPTLFASLRKPAPSPLSETEPYFLVEPSADPQAESSNSQMSIGTHPVASADETFPSFRSRSNVFPHGYHRGSRDNSKWVMIIGAMIVAVVLSAVAIKMIVEMLP
jgi:serine/threonine protein kinase